MVKISSNKQVFPEIFYDEKSSKFKYSDSTINNDLNLGTADDFLKMLNNLNVCEFIHGDEGILTNYNDCWSDLQFFTRKNEYTLIHNSSDNLYLPFLLDEDGNRFILPTTFFKVELEYIDSVAATLRFANLQESFLNINLDNFNLNEGDTLVIVYKNGIVEVYVNNNLLKTYTFLLIENKGYLTWRLPNNSSVSYKNFRIYKNDLMLAQIFQENMNIKNHYPKLLSEIKEFKDEFDDFKKITNNRLESANFLFNNIYLDYQLSPNELLNNVQGLSIELLSFVDNVCKKHNLSWWLDYGTLIGAIRHENFIPWDDDIDIGMMRSEYNKFNKVLLEEIKNNNLEDFIKVSYRKRKFNGQRITSFIQIFILHKPENSKYNTIFAGVDIFPYDYIVDYDEENIEDVYQESKNCFYTQVTAGNDLNSLYMGLDYNQALKEYYKKLNLSFESGDIIPGVEGSCGLINLYDVFIIKKEDLFPLKQNKYANKIFPVPNNYDAYLKAIYGNYMTIPLDIRTHGRIDNFRQISNVNELFTKDINRLKLINSKFK